MITTFFVKLTGMKEYMVSTYQRGSVRNVVSYGLVRGWIGLNVIVPLHEVAFMESPLLQRTWVVNDDYAFTGWPLDEYAFMG